MCCEIENVVVVTVWKAAETKNRKSNCHRCSQNVTDMTVK